LSSKEGKEKSRPAECNKSTRSNSLDTFAITGANGFLGRHLVAQFIGQHHYRLRLLVRDRNVFQDMPSDKVTICEGDLLIPESLKSFLQSDITLIHLAYIDCNEAANIRATANLIEIVKQSNVKRVVHCSTAVVVGFKATGVITENTMPVPETEYQRTKYRIEEMLRAELPPKVELVILRPTEIIGPGGHGLRRLIKRVHCERSYKKFLYHCVLKYRRFNYISVYNVVAALILLATTNIKQKNEIYIISDDDDGDNNYAAVEKIINSTLKHKHEYCFDVGLPLYWLSLILKLIPGHSPPDRVYSYDKISDLGYKKVISLHSALSETALSEMK
jgi:nucleoside-diphosphate-sugar epimerase